ncbi:MAG: tRNA lysidine(34) synthetase TilS [Microbacteriaceae bacterium]
MSADRTAGRGRLSPAVASVRNAVGAFFERHDVMSGSTVLVAVSGGADSMALAMAAKFVATARGVTVAAAIIDHGLQEQSADVAGTTADTLRHHGFDTVFIRLVDVGTDGGPEAAAREARYLGLMSVATEVGATMILTGHTRNDQAESVLLGLTRGSGPRSVRGMPSFDGLIGRPLLDVTRETTVAACAAEEIEPWEDPHNDDSSFTRVRIRNIVIPTLESELGPGIVDALARTAELLRDDDDALDLLASGMARTVLTTEGEVALDVAGTASKPRALRTRLIRLAAAEAFLSTLSHTQTTAVDALLVNWHGQKPIDVTGGSVVRQDGRLIFRPRSEA